jgi:DNA-binding NarL/FixJ family response regulator
MRQARIFIVDDHPLVRHGLNQLVGGEPEFTVVGEAATMDEALSKLSYNIPDLTIIDLTLPDGNGLDLVKRLLARHPKLIILISSMHDEMMFAERALKAGAKGYINKSATGDEMIAAIKQVLKGKRYLSQQVSARLSRKTAGKNQRIGQSPAERLSNRELEVFESIGRGMGTGDIASSLKLSIKTIESHRANIKKKLGLSSAGELIRSAIQWSLEAE